jgi:hypothetical protein
MQKQEAERAVGLQAVGSTKALGTSDQREGMMNHELVSSKTAVQLPGLAGAFRSERGTSLEAIIGGWLEEKAHRSPKTREAYRTTLLAFRALLQDNGLDLLWKGDDFLPTIADYAQVFARTRSPQARRQGAVKPATQAQRLAILSSFYLYAIKRRHLLSGNPIDGVDRPNVQPYAQAAPWSRKRSKHACKRLMPPPCKASAISPSWRSCWQRDAASPRSLPCSAGICRSPGSA